MTDYKGYLGILLFIMSVACTSSLNAQYYNTIDGADVVPVGKIAVTPVYNSVYVARGGSFSTLVNSYGARFGLGLFNNFDVTLQFDFLDFPGIGGKAMYLTPKYAVGKTGFAVSLPFMAIDSEKSDQNFGFSPTILYSRLISKKGIEIGVNASRTEFVNHSHGWYTFAIAPAYKKDKYSVRAEYGFSLTDGQIPNAYHYGIAITYLIP